MSISFSAFVSEAVGNPTVWMMALCSILMAMGTSIGGEKIIKSVGMNVVKLEKYQGFSADLAATLCLLVASFTGMPVSTTHTKTTAIIAWKEILKGLERCLDQCEDTAGLIEGVIMKNT